MERGDGEGFAASLSLVIEAVKHITLSFGFQGTENEIARLKNAFSYEFRG